MIDRQRMQPARRAQPTRTAEAEPAGSGGNEQDRDERDAKAHVRSPRSGSYLRMLGSSGFSAVDCCVAAVASAPANGTRPRRSSGPPVLHIFAYCAMKSRSLGLAAMCSPFTYTYSFRAPG